MNLSQNSRLVWIGLLFLGLTMLGQACDSSPSATRADGITELSDLLPEDTRGVLSVDIHHLLTGSSAAGVADLLTGDSGEAALNELFGAISELAQNIDLAGTMDRGLLVQTTDVSEGLFLITGLTSDVIDEVTAGPALTPDGTYGGGSHAIYLDINGNSLSLVTGGVLIVGKRTALESVLDVLDGVSPANASDIAPFLSALEDGSPFSFLYGLPALLNDDIAADRSLRGAKLVSGSLDFDSADISGHVSFHTSNAATFVDAYNALDSASDDAPLILDAPIANGLGQVVVTIPSAAIDKSTADLIASRNTLKKLVLGMEAYDYAEDVNDPGNPPWLDLVVSSEADGEGSPGSVFIRWEFKDQAAIDAFEAKELPPGFTLAPTRFLESDAPGYFLALNLYNSAGGSIVDGARAEWDVFVQPTDGDTRPRFMVIDALAEAVSADPVNGLTPPEPLSHGFVGDQVVTHVGVMEDDIEVTVFTSSVPRPSDAAPIARFTREMAIGNDYIYWGNGVLDRVLYNATTFNYDALFADLDQVEITDNSHWKQYLDADPTYVVYYLNTLEYIASPWWNLDSPYLDITPEWLADLYAFKNNGNYLTLMRDAVRGLFRGTDDAIAKVNVENSTPSTYYNFRIIDPDDLSEALQLPDGYSLSETRFFQDDPAEDHYLTLAVYEIEGSLEGTRAEWGVYVDDGDGREQFMIIELQTEDAAVDPVSLVNLPSEVLHQWERNALCTVLSSSTVDFEASIETQGGTEAALSLDWIEAGDTVCHINGICDKRFYDGETLGVPVHLPGDVTIGTIVTPWNAFIDTTSSVVFYRDNFQEYAVKPWHNVKVVVEEEIPDPIEDGTHVITGTGTLVGQTNPAVDSTYTYAGAGTLVEGELYFAIDQQIENALGESHIITSGSFDLTSGLGTQTVEACIGPPLMCAGVDPLIGTPEATSEYTARNLDASDPDSITWDVIFTITIPGFGDADSDSTFSAILGTQVLCEDDDGDGYGDPASSFCDQPEPDCVDDPSADPAVCADCACGTAACAPCARCIHPGAEEFSGDDVDSNCNDDPDCFIVTATSIF